MGASTLTLLLVSYLSRKFFRKFPHLDLIGSLEEKITKQQNNNLKQNALANSDIVEETNI